jgi:hypothetical protein
MTLFATLLLAHLIADFPLQSNFVFRLKTRSPAGLLLHVGLHLLILCLLLVDPWRYWPALLFLGVSHYTIDWLKVKRPSSPEWPAFLLDQAAHIAVLAIIALWQPNMILQPMPDWLLWLGLAGTMLSALAMFGWIVVNDWRELSASSGRELQLAQRSMFQFSQRGGRFLVVSLVLVWVLI